MAGHRRSGKLAVILHADVAGSTDLVHQDEHLTHERIQDTFRRFGDIIGQYHGRVRELRGDALLAEFERTSGAVGAAIAFQADQKAYIASLTDPIQPTVRVGIAMGEVVIADNTITGAGVVLAQRLEQMAEPGGVVLQAAAQETIPNRFPFEYTDLGGHEVKGFDKPVQAYSVNLKSNTAIPLPEKADHRIRNTLVAIASLTAIVAGVALMWFEPWEVREEPASVERMALPLPDKPSIAVLPFDVLGDESTQDYLGDGLTNDLITALSKFSNLFVIASHSSFVYKDKPVKVQTVSEELGVRYVLKGSVQKSTDGVRINAQLIDVLSGRHLWAERFDRQTSDLLAIQDEIVESVVANLAIQVDVAERERAKSKNTGNLEAYDYYLRADDVRFDWDKATNNEARRLLEKAIELDPGYARAYSALAWTYVNDWRWGWVDDPDASKNLALEVARKAVEIDPFDAEGYHALGVVHLYNREFDKAIPLYEKAIALNPNDARRLVGTAPAWIYVGQTEEAVAQIEHAMRLNPHHSDDDLNFLGWAYYEAKEYEKALTTLNKVEKSPWHAVLAATYVRLGRMEEAQAEVATFLKNNPEYSIERGETFPYKDEEQRNHYYGALAEAGVPEHPPLKLPDKPSIAVLPFTNMSDDAQQEYFVDGMTEDLITDLSKLSGLFVIARNSSFTYKGKAVGVKQVARELGVRYVLEGSVRRAADQVRINAQLIDATSGGHLWAERYDGFLQDIFALQDRVTTQIVDALSVTLTPQELKGLGSFGTSNVSAHDAYLQGLSFYARDTPEDNAKAEDHFKRAIEFDPDFKRAYTALAKVYYKAWDSEYAKAIGVYWRHAIFLAHENLAKVVGANIADAHVVRSWMAMVKHQAGVAIREAKRALNLNASDVDGLKAHAKALIYVGQYAEGRKLANRVIRLDPAVPAEPLYLIGLSYFASGDYETAVEYIERALEYGPKTSEYTGLLATAYGKLGMEKNATASWLRYENVLITRLAEQRVSVTDAVYTFPFQDGEVLEHLADGFEAAGAYSSRPRYLKLDRDTRLTGQEIKHLLFGHPISGSDYWNANSWTQTRTVDGKVSHSGQPIHTGSYDTEEGESWIEDDQLCDRWPVVDEEITICAAVFRDVNRGQDDYYLVTDQGPHPFRQGIEVPEKYMR